MIPVAIRQRICISSASTNQSPIAEFAKAGQNVMDDNKIMNSDKRRNDLGEILFDQGKIKIVSVPVRSKPLFRTDNESAPLLRLISHYEILSRIKTNFPT
jgi:hypothetical protein